jgi:hypothetical protein
MLSSLRVLLYKKGLLAGLAENRVINRSSTFFGGATILVLEA